VKILNPLTDDRWDDLVARHPCASAFHQRGWLEALSRTYGYEPLALTSTAADQPLSDGVVLCRVSSWITGTRLVSLPFADHCDPLLNDIREYRQFMEWLRVARDLQRYKYVELRPLSEVHNFECGLNQLFVMLHELDIRASLSRFSGLHRIPFSEGYAGRGTPFA
jgi:hypothetical protein